MCSSPKGNGSKRPRRLPSKTYSESFTSEQRARFTEVANRAEQRREQRFASNQRWQQSYAHKASHESRLERSKSDNPSIFTWFTQLFSEH